MRADSSDGTYSLRYRSAERTSITSTPIFSIWRRTAAIRSWFIASLPPARIGRHVALQTDARDVLAGCAPLEPLWVLAVRVEAQAADHRRAVALDAVLLLMA